MPPLPPHGKLLITTFGLGLLRPAPGTWGSLPTCAVAGVLMLMGLGPGLNASSGSGTSSFLQLSPLASTLIYHAALATILINFSVVCVRFGPAAETAFGKKDPGRVVADETAGQAIPLMFLPSIQATGPLIHTGQGPFADTLAHALALCGLAFLAFRIFDILKLWPANGLQRLTGGWGILIDDLVAGVQAMIVVQVVARLVL